MNTPNRSASLLSIPGTVTRLLALVPLLCVVSGCLVGFVKQYHLDYQLETVGTRIDQDQDARLSPGRETVSRKTVDWPNYQKRNEFPELKTYQLEDEYISVSWSLLELEMMLVLKNRTGRPLEILWSEAKVDAGSGAVILAPYSVMVEVEGSEGDDWMVPGDAGLVPPGGEVFFNVYPDSFLIVRQSKYRNSNKPFLYPGEWLFGERVISGKRDFVETRAGEVVGEEVLINLPVVVDGRRLEYRFQVSVTAASVVGQRVLTA